MRKVNVHEAKTHLSKLLDRAGAGEEIVIAKAGKPVAKLGPLEKKQKPRKKGLLKGKIRVSAAFVKPLPGNLIAAFEGKKVR